MRIVLAPDSYKGSLTAGEVAAAMAEGFARACPDWEIERVPLADGGEGTVAAMVEATGGSFEHTVVDDPLGRPVEAAWGLLGDGRTAIIEMAAASGLPLLTPAEYDPLRTSTYGTGQLLVAALGRGVRRIILGLGGSATVDGGTGMACALGARFLDVAGRELAPGGGALAELARVELDGLDPRLAQVEVLGACDVDNPLTGEQGAARTYGPQKGATPQDVQRLEQGLRRLAHVLQQTPRRPTQLLSSPDMGWAATDAGAQSGRQPAAPTAEGGRDGTVLRALERMPGGGAAGGLGAGCVALLGATLRPGVELVLQGVRLAERLEGCGLVVTGEGRMDAQTARGKAPCGVARLAASQGLPVIALNGSLAEDAGRLDLLGFSAWFASVTRPMSEEEATGPGAALALAALAEQVGRTLRLGSRL